MGQELLSSPDRWLPNKVAEIRDVFDEMAEEIADSLNHYVESQEELAREAGTIFDPKTVFKSKVGVQSLAREVVSHVKFQARRNPDYGFQLAPDAHE